MAGERATRRKVATQKARDCSVASILSGQVDEAKEYVKQIKTQAAAAIKSAEEAMKILASNFEKAKKRCGVPKRMTQKMKQSQRNVEMSFMRNTNNITRRQSARLQALKSQKVQPAVLSAIKEASASVEKQANSVDDLADLFGGISELGSTMNMFSTKHKKKSVPKFSYKPKTAV
jgi:hypothetical protein